MILAHIAGSVYSLEREQPVRLKTTCIRVSGIDTKPVHRKKPEKTQRIERSTVRCIGTKQGENCTATFTSGLCMSYHAFGAWSTVN